MEGSEVNDEINVKNWSKDKHVQDVVTFLRREAAMADEQLIYEVSKPDVPGRITIFKPTCQIDYQSVCA